jgi:hypothetical protein
VPDLTVVTHLRAVVFRYVLDDGQHSFPDCASTTSI